MIGFIAMYIGTIIAAIFVHELAHAWYITEHLKRKVTFICEWKRIGWKYDSSGISKNDKRNIYLSGILAGFIPLIAGMLYLNLTNVAFLFMILSYLIGARVDIMRMVKT